MGNAATALEKPTALIGAFSPEHRARQFHTVSGSAVAITEVSRAPNPGERIALDSVLIIGKSTKLEWDMRTGGITSEAEMVAEYQKQGVDADVVLNAHREHHAAIEVFEPIFEPDQFLALDAVSREELRERIKKASLVVSLGGDDHFKSVSQLVTDQLILGVNSDPKRSVGALLQLTASEFRQQLGDFLEGKFLVEEWSRLKITVNGAEAPLATSEIFIAEENAKFGSRSHVTYRGKEFTSKGSGLLIATGAGSTGWFRSASRYCLPEDTTWARTAPVAVLVEREPYGEITEDRLLLAELEAGETVKITSLHNHGGLISVDSIADVPFPRGAVAQVQVAEERLKVVVGI